jgi:penicillin-binding protein 2
LGGDTVNNGVFVCFAPYDDPEIAVAIVIEQGGSGSALASTAVEIINAWFDSGETNTNITGENQLLP